MSYSRCMWRTGLSWFQLFEPTADITLGDRIVSAMKSMCQEPSLLSTQSELHPTNKYMCPHTTLN